MCGIVGFISREENKGIIIKKMADKIIHRGPDEEGYYIDENIALGHRRLSIIDLDNGTQPMKNKELIVIFNGEIYKICQKNYEVCLHLPFGIERKRGYFVLVTTLE